jgi:hypothetical protein
VPLQPAVMIDTPTVRPVVIDYADSRVEQVGAILPALAASGSEPIARAMMCVRPPVIARG